MKRTWNSLRSHWKPTEQNSSVQAAEANRIRRNIQLDTLKKNKYVHIKKIHQWDTEIYRICYREQYYASYGVGRKNTRSLRNLNYLVIRRVKYKVFSIKKRKLFSLEFLKPAKVNMVRYFIGQLLLMLWTQYKC